MAESFGIKISKQGVPVETATGTDVFLTSSRTCLKVKAPSSTTIVISGGLGSRTIAHGQPFIPVVISYILFGGGLQPIPFYDVVGNTGGIDMDIDSTNIIWTANNILGNIPDGTYVVVYFLSETESAN